jgi:hypothetical protein
MKTVFLLISQFSRRRCHLLNTSVETFVAQSILKTSLDAKVLQASSSKDQLTDTCRPHQKVSRKKVDVIAHPVKTVTA